MAASGDGSIWAIVVFAPVTGKHIIYYEDRQQVMIYHPRKNRMFKVADNLKNIRHLQFIGKTLVFTAAESRKDSIFHMYVRRAGRPLKKLVKNVCGPHMDLVLSNGGSEPMILWCSTDKKEKRIRGIDLSGRRSDFTVPAAYLRLHHAAGDRLYFFCTDRDTNLDGIVDKSDRSSLVRLDMASGKFSRITPDLFDQPFFYRDGAGSVIYCYPASEFFNAIYRYTPPFP
jgi:hypothetical protein